MKTLYHYTSLNGILGILQSRSIWATHASFLNDASEFFHGLELARQIAVDIIMEDDYRAAFGLAMGDAIEKISADDIYVASLSEKGDLLSQWRGYCPTGAGLCLGFDISNLRSFCEARGYRLEQCIYKHSKQIQQIKILVNQCFERFPKPKLTRNDYELLNSKDQINAELDYGLQTSKGSDKPKADAAIGWFCTEISKLAPLFKNEGFHEEAEWRIIAKGPQETVQFRANSSYMAPYVELEVLSGAAESALREVIIGPNPNQSRCETSIKMMLASCGLGEVKVLTSPLPFNSW
jgi:hypothetical protein